MTQPDADTEQQLAYLATELLGWSFDPLHKAFTVIDGGTMGRANLSYLLTGNGMLEIIEAMRPCALRIDRNGDGILVHFAGGRFQWDTPLVVSKPCASLPEAVARAAYAALQESAK